MKSSMLCCFFLAFLSVSLLHPNEVAVDYGSFESGKELIQFETAQILRIPADQYGSLSESYLFRAESYFLLGQDELALADFQTSCELAALCEEDRKIPLLFQSLFGVALVYGRNETYGEFYATVDTLKAVLNSSQCVGSREMSGTSSLVYLTSNTTTSPPIYGPDHISIKECIEFAEGTARKCRYLISLVPRSEVKVILNILIDDLEGRARGCCRAGGVWKACLRPLANKWYLWNQKWQLFQIPPDPSWD